MQEVERISVGEDLYLQKKLVTFPEGYNRSNKSYCYKCYVEFNIQSQNNGLKKILIEERTNEKNKIYFFNTFMFKPVLLWAS